MAMTSSRPYLVRALYQWILDNNCTPYVLVDALRDGVEVPLNYVKDGQIVLNIAPSAVVDLDIGDDALKFNARFSGVATDVYVPAAAALGIYARETGQGMLFENETSPGPGAPTPGSSDDNESGGIAPAGRNARPRLKLVK